MGQGKAVLDRVNHHFSGRGNGDVYADYKYGDFFTIKMIKLENSGFYTLNELERNIFEGRFFKEKTQSTLAKELEISQMTISRIERKVVQKLRKEYEK